MINHTSKTLLLSTIASYLAACSNLTTLDRSTPLDFETRKDSGGVAIHLDAKQRLVLQKDFGVVCAEPSPDALTATAANLSTSFQSQSKVNAALSAALAENAASIGLRTQSIQLMRDSLYRVCELYFSKALNGAQVMLLHQKYQDVMVAILAIEQLTGAVTPKSAALSTSAKGDALSRSVDLGEAVRNATEKVDAAKADLKSAETKLKEAEKAKNTAHDANEATKADANATATQKAEKEEALKTTTEAYNAAKETVAKAETNFKAEEKRLDGYKKAEDAALAQVKAEASGTAALQGGSSSSTLDQHTAEKVSAAVENIVNEILRKDYSRDVCFNLLSDINPAALNARAATLGSQLQSALPEDKGRLFEQLDRTNADIATFNYCLNIVKTRVSELNSI